MDELYKLKEMLCKELEEYGSKGEMSAGSLATIDTLAHALKNLDKIIEAKEMEDEGSYMDGGSYRGGGSYARGGRGGYSREGGSYRGGQGGSYARGRNQYSRRSGRGYSREGEGMEYVEELREMMQDLPPEAKQHVQKAIQTMEQM